MKLMDLSTGWVATTVTWWILGAGSIGVRADDGLHAVPQKTAPDLVPGVWKDITPPVPGYAQTFGSASLELSPIDPNVIYVPIDTLGLWKTTDRGANWQRLGLRTTYLDSPFQVRVHPADAKNSLLSRIVISTGPQQVDPG
jgi:hypothetical protein